MNCAGEETPETADLFGGEKAGKAGTTTADLLQTPRSAGEVSPGVVLTAAEKDMAEQRRKAAEEAAKKAAEAEENGDEDGKEEKKNGNSRISKLKRWVDKFLKEPDE